MVNWQWMFPKVKRLYLYSFWFISNEEKKKWKRKTTSVRRGERERDRKYDAAQDMFACTHRCWRRWQWWYSTHIIHIMLIAHHIITSGIHKCCERCWNENDDDDEQQEKEFSHSVSETVSHWCDFARIKYMTCTHKQTDGTHITDSHTYTCCCVLYVVVVCDCSRTFECIRCASAVPNM